MDAGLFAQYVMNGLMLGMMYALVAVGFTLFFGVLDIIKFSHGDVLTVGAFTGLATYIVILIVARALGAIAKLPLLGLSNALGGAVIGFAKGAILLWLILFIALFFPLSPDIRDALHQSRLAPYLVTYDAPIDDAMLSTIPWFARPFAMPYFRRISSASISARGITGIFRRCASTISALSGATAEETTTTCAPWTLAAWWPS